MIFMLHSPIEINSPNQLEATPQFHIGVRQATIGKVGIKVNQINHEINKTIKHNWINIINQCR